MKKKILIDMDDVIIKDYLLNAVNFYLTKKYTYDDISGYYIQDIIEDKKSFFNFFFSENFYKFAYIEDDVKDTLIYLNKKYDVYILSSYIYRECVKESSIVLKYKHEYLIDNFNFLDPNKFIFTNSKNIIYGDVKIDDKIENLENAEMKILFTAYHNKNISEKELKKKGIIRVRKFSEIKNIL